MKDLLDPFYEIKKFRKEMDNIFNNFWKKERKLFNVVKTKLREPLVDIEEKKNELIVNAELPGIEKKDIKVIVEEDKIELKAERKEEKEEKKKNFYRKERSYSGFYKAFSLPARIDPQKAKYSFKDGIFKIMLPKTKQLGKKKVLLLK